MTPRNRLVAILGIVAAAGCAGRPRGGGDKAAPEEILPAFRVAAPTSSPVAPTRLTGFTQQEVYGRLSPSGRVLLYSSNAKDSFDLWLRDLAGGEPVALTTHPAMDTMPAWSPDGEQVVFVSMRDDVKGDLFLIAADADDDSPTQLTGRKLGELFPVFSPDSRFVYFAQGPEGLYRIVRLDLEAAEDKADRDDPRAEKAVTGDGYSHPAVSPDGRWLAVTKFAGGGASQIALLEIRDAAGPDPSYAEPLVVTSGPYAKGFPQFSPDGKTLFFMTFHHGAPKGADAESEGSLWSAPLADLVAGKGLETARQLTSDRAASVLTQAHDAGLVYGAAREGNFDILLVPPVGLLPKLHTAKAHAMLARHFDDPYEKAFAYRGLADFPVSSDTQLGLYRGLLIYTSLGEYEKVAEVGALLAGQPAAEGTPAALPELARCRAASAAAEAVKAREVATGEPFGPRDARNALERLTEAAGLATTPEGKAQCEVQRALVHLLADEWQEAAQAYRGVLNDPKSPPGQAGQAFVGLGRVLQQMPGSDQGTAEYFLGAFDRFPNEIEVLDAAAHEALAAATHPGDPQNEIETLRLLIDRHARKDRFAARAQLRLGRLYAETGQQGLAAAAMETLVARWPTVETDVSEAGLLAGEYAARYAADLRTSGRFNEASGFYDRALANYARVMKKYPPLHRLHREARQHSLTLALQRAFQAEQDGDGEKAYALYQQILKDEPNAIQALRKVIQHDLHKDLPPPATEAMTEPEVKARRKEIESKLEDNWDAVFKVFDARRDADENDFGAVYALGYLWTYDPDFRPKSLDNAEEYLVRAAQLEPSSPFPHMTLGWVHLMREQYFDKVKDAWVVRALDEYTIAYALNDRGIDLQTEADLLVSHGNAWAALGNGWSHAYEKYHEREALVALGAGFLNPEQKAMFYFSFAQAAYMTDHFEEAEDHYETARAIVRGRLPVVDPVLAEGYREMDAQIVAHLALVNYFVRDFESSNRYFEQTIDLYKARGRVRLLPALTRSVAYNLILMGRYNEALAKLEEARALYAQHGGIRPDEGTRIALTPEGSLFFGGFVGESEKHVQTALTDLIFRDNHALWYAAQQAAEQLDQRRKLYKENENPDYARAFWTLQGRVANSALRAGDRPTFTKELDAIFEAASELQMDDSQPDGEEFVGRPELFQFMTVAMTNRAEQMLADLAQGRPQDPDALPELAARLRQMEDWRKRLEITGRGRLIEDEEQRLKYLNAAALLFMAHGRALATEGWGSAVAAEGAEGAKGKTGWGTFSLKGKFESWMLQTTFFADAAGLLLEAVKRTAPVPGPTVRPSVDTNRTYVVDRVRWHVESLVNLAEVASYFSARESLGKDRGMDLLMQAHRICHVDEILGRNAERARVAALPPPDAGVAPEEPVDDSEEAPEPPPAAPTASPLGEMEETPLPVPLDLGHACWLVDMDVASRNGDLPAARAVIDRFVGTWPGLLGERYRSHGASVRQHLFTRAMETAAAANDWKAVFELAELQDRKLVADELAGFGFASPSPPLQTALEPVRQWTDFYRRAWENQTTDKKGEDAHEAALAAMTKARDPALWKVIWDRVRVQSPAVHDLLVPQPFPYGDAAQALGNRASVLSAVPVGDQVVFFHLKPDNGTLRVEHAVVKASRAQLHAAGFWGEQNLPELTALLPVSLKAWLADDATIYFDLLRLGPAFPVEALARQWAPNAQHVFLAGAQEAVDAWRARNLYVTGGLALASDTLDGTPVTRAVLEPVVEGLPGWRVLEEEKLQLKRTAGHMQQHGMQIWALPLRVEEDSVANVRLGLKGEAVGLEDYRFPLRLGDRFKTSFVAALGVHSGLRVRDAHVMLTRYLHALGVPTVALAPAGNLKPEVVTPWVGRLAPTLGQKSAAEAVAAAGPLEAPAALLDGEPDEDPLGRDVVRVDRVRLYGWPGLSPKDASVAGTQADQMAREGRAAYDVGQYRAAAASLEPALALWAASGEAESAKVQETQALLARTHAALGDTRAAVLLQLSLVSGLEKSGAPVLRRYEAWLQVPAWQTAGGVHQDAIDTCTSIKTALEADMAKASAEEKRELQGYLADAWATEATALEALGRYPLAASGFEKAAALALAAEKDAPEANSLKRRVGEASALAARVARARLSDSARAKRSLTRAAESVPNVDTPAYLAAEKRHAELVQQVAKATDEVAAQGLRDELRKLLATLEPLRRDVRARAVVLREAALVKLGRSDAAGAKADAAEALTLSQPLPDPLIAHGCRAALAAAYLDLGDAAMSLDVADEGVRAARLSPLWTARFQAARGKALVRLARLAEGRKALEEAVAGARASDDEDGYGEALRSQGLLEMAAGDFGRAAAIFRHAEIEDRKRGDMVHVAEDLVDTGRVLRAQGQLREARDKFIEARQAATESDAVEILVRVELGLGRVLMAEKDFAGALGAFENGIKAEARLSNPVLRWKLLLGRADALSALNRPAEALPAVEEAAATAELLPAQPRRLPGQTKTDLEFKDIYDRLVTLYLGQKRPEDAFLAAERWRSRGFVDLATRGPEFVARGRAALDKYNAALSQLRQAEASAREATDRERAGARKAAEEAREAAETARKALENVDAQLPSFLAVDARPFAELKGDLPGDTTLLAYYTMAKSTVIFVGKASGLTATEIPAGAEAITQAVRSYRKHTTAFDALETESKRLYDWLLAPVADQLDTRVLVVPEGPVNLLPLAGLWTGEAWAVQKWRFAYLPSANHLRALKPVGAVAAREPMAFNWAGMGPDSQPQAGTKRYFKRLEAWRALAEQWPHLPFTVKETEAFRESFAGTTVYAGDKATREQFLAEAGKADLLEVATHAVYVADNPMLSYFQFGGVPKGESFPAFEEQRVTVYDVLATPLKATVATLSACETGLADPEGGEGLAGMHRAFLAAGARSVVSSLWRVSDLSSGVLMKNFHRNLRDRDPATALRDAQLKVMRFFPHPAYWAGFRLDGVTK